LEDRAVDGQDDRFGAPPSASTPPADAGFGFFGGTPASPYAAPTPGAGAPAPNPAFGAPNPAFGAPAPAFGTTYQPVPTAAGGNSKQIVAAILIGIVVLAGIGFGWNVYQQHKPIGVPTTLAGVARNTDPSIQQGLDTALTALKKEDPGKKIVVAAYGSVAQKEIIILVGVRGRLKSIESDFAQGGITGGQQQIGHNSCAAMPTGFVCERTSGHLTEGVVSISQTRTMAQTSALLDEAWSKA
jgi:hypothetical protein